MMRKRKGKKGSRGVFKTRLHSMGALSLLSLSRSHFLSITKFPLPTYQAATKDSHSLPSLSLTLSSFSVPLTHISLSVSLSVSLPACLSLSVSLPVCLSLTLALFITLIRVCVSVDLSKVNQSHANAKPRLKRAAATATSHSCWIRFFLI